MSLFAGISKKDNPGGINSNSPADCVDVMKGNETSFNSENLTSKQTPDKTNDFISRMKQKREEKETRPHEPKEDREEERKADDSKKSKGPDKEQTEEEAKKQIRGGAEFIVNLADTFIPIICCAIAKEENKGQYNASAQSKKEVLDSLDNYMNSVEIKVTPLQQLVWCALAAWGMPLGFALYKRFQLRKKAKQQAKDATNDKKEGKATEQTDVNDTQEAEEVKDDTPAEKYRADKILRKCKETGLQYETGTGYPKSKKNPLCDQFINRAAWTAWTNKHRSTKRDKTDKK